MKKKKQKQKQTKNKTKINHNKSPANQSNETTTIKPNQPKTNKKQKNPNLTEKCESEIFSKFVTGPD